MFVLSAMREVVRNFHRSSNSTFSFPFFRFFLLFFLQFFEMHVLRLFVCLFRSLHCMSVLINYKWLI